MKNILKQFFRKLKMEVSYYPHGDLRRRILLLNHHKINTIIDVGANTGQYVREIRDLGFKGDIISFEPLSEAYSVLLKKSKFQKNWTVANIALGSSNQEAVINVASNMASSSLLPMNEIHRQAEPDVINKGTQTIQVKTLDSIWGEYLERSVPNYYLKIDTQGYEKDVLKGAENSLSKINGIQLEMSLEELYEGEWQFDQMYQYIISKGFKLHSVEPQFYNNKNGQLLQMDGIFYRK